MKIIFKRINLIIIIKILNLTQNLILIHLNLSKNLKNLKKKSLYIISTLKNKLIKIFGKSNSNLVKFIKFPKKLIAFYLMILSIIYFINNQNNKELLLIN